MTTFSANRVKVPIGLPDILSSFAKKVLYSQPENIYQFGADFFEDLVKKRDGGEDDLETRVSQIEETTTLENHRKSTTSARGSQTPKVARPNSKSSQSSSSPTEWDELNRTTPNTVRKSANGAKPKKNDNNDHATKTPPESNRSQRSAVGSAGSARSSKQNHAVPDESKGPVKSAGSIRSEKEAQYSHVNNSKAGDSRRSPLASNRSETSGIFGDTSSYRDAQEGLKVDDRSETIKKDGSISEPNAYDRVKDDEISRSAAVSQRSNVDGMESPIFYKNYESTLDRATRANDRASKSPTDIKIRSPRPDKDEEDKVQTSPKEAARLSTPSSKRETDMKLRSPHPDKDAEDKVQSSPKEAARLSTPSSKRETAKNESDRKGEFEDKPRGDGVGKEELIGSPGSTARSVDTQRLQEKKKSNSRDKTPVESARKTSSKQESQRGSISSPHPYSPTSNMADEEVIDIDLKDPEVEKAALFIQSGFKGLKFRKKNQLQQKEASSAPHSAHLPRPPVEPPGYKSLNITPRANQIHSTESTHRDIDDNVAGDSTENTARRDETQRNSTSRTSLKSPSDEQNTSLKSAASAHETKANKTNEETGTAEITNKNSSRTAAVTDRSLKEAELDNEALSTRRSETQDEDDEELQLLKLKNWAKPTSRVASATYRNNPEDDVESNRSKVSSPFKDGRPKSIDADAKTETALNKTPRPIDKNSETTPDENQIDENEEETPRPLTSVLPTNRSQVSNLTSVLPTNRSQVSNLASSYMQNKSVVSTSRSNKSEVASARSQKKEEVGNEDVDDEKKAAVVKIQSGVCGMQIRAKKARESNEAENRATSRLVSGRDTGIKSPSAPEDDEEGDDEKRAIHDNAVTKIQSGVSAAAVRKNKKTGKSMQELNDSSPAVNSLDNYSGHEIKAVITLQAGVRGMHVRKLKRAEPATSKDMQENSSKNGATSKIQSGISGAQERKKYTDNKINDESITKTEIYSDNAEQKITENLDEDVDKSQNENYNNSVTKIQSGIQSKNTRKIYKSTDANHDIHDKTIQEKNTNIFADSENSTSKIQSGIKGMTVRKESKELLMKESKENNENPTNSFENKQSEPEPISNKQINLDKDASSKIQSGVKGMQIRKESKNKLTQEDKLSAVAPSTAVESPREINTKPPVKNDKDQSTTKIQAGVAGMQMRKANLAAKKEQELSNKPISDSDQIHENVDKEKSVTKIQSGFSGHRARQELNQSKNACPDVD